MRHQKIVNPKTNRTVSVVVWDINPRDILAKFKAGEYKSAKDLSWDLLSDEEATEQVEESEYGDSASNNFVLNIMENALDWSLGLRVIHFIYAAVKAGKMPKPFQVAANKGGDVFIITASGRVL